MLHVLRELVSRWRIYSRTRSELAQHSHRELYDLRIGPGDIDRVAWEGAFGSLAPAVASPRGQAEATGPA